VTSLELRFATAPTIIAAAVDTADPPRLKGLLLPHGIGQTSAGPVTVDPTSDVTVAEHVPLTLHHDRARPIGRLDGSQRVDDGLHAEWALSRTTPDAVWAVAAVDEGILTGQSVELSDVVLDGDDRLVSATLVAASLVTVPAFPQARVTLAAEGAPPMHPEPTPPVTAAEPAPVVAAPRITATPRLTLDAAAAMIAATFRGEIGPAELSAALADATTEMTSLGRGLAPQWLGKLWEEATYPRPHVDACTGPRPICGSLNMQGWRWKTGLAVDKWTGNKADIPSNAPAIESATVTGQRWAGGIDVAREIVDLGDGDLIRDLMVMAVNDYRHKTDLACLADLIAGATALTPAPTTFTAGILAAVRAVRDTRHPLGVIWVATDILDEEMLVAGQLRWPSGGLNVDGGDPLGIRVVADPDLTDGQILAMASGAATFYETGPIRVNAVDIAKGGLDEAVFGYTATLVNAPAAVVKATVTPAA
jgi:hypothetical protein